MSIPAIPSDWIQNTNTYSKPGYVVSCLCIRPSDNIAFTHMVQTAIVMNGDWIYQTTMYYTSLATAQASLMKRGVGVYV